MQVSNQFLDLSSSVLESSRVDPCRSIVKLPQLFLYSRANALSNGKLGRPALPTGCHRRQPFIQPKRQLGEPHQDETSHRLACLTQQRCSKHVSGITPFAGGYRPTCTLPSVDPARQKKIKIPRQARRAESRLQRALAKTMMRVTVPTLVVYPAQWIAAR